MTRRIRLTANRTLRSIVIAAAEEVAMNTNESQQPGQTDEEGQEAIHRDPPDTTLTEGSDSDDETDDLSDIGTGTESDENVDDDDSEVDPDLAD